MALLGRRCGHIAAGHLHHMQAFGIQLQGGKFAAPHRAGVDGVDAVADMQRNGINARFCVLETLEEAKAFAEKMGIEKVQIIG